MLSFMRLLVLAYNDSRHSACASASAKLATHSSALSHMLSSWVGKTHSSSPVAWTEDPEQGAK